VGGQRPGAFLFRRVFSQYGDGNISVQGSTSSTGCMDRLAQRPLPCPILLSSCAFGWARGTLPVRRPSWLMYCLGANYTVFTLKCCDKELPNKGEAALKAKSM
jgi:hypothetical protein